MMWPASRMVAWSALSVPLLASALTNHEILVRADRARGNVEGISWTVDINSKDRKGNREMTYLVRGRGFDVLSESTRPPKRKGDIVLMVKGNMWFYKPGLSKPVPISRRQKMMGNAAYGDIAATNYANDYSATLLGEELVDGESCYVFQLESTNNKTTYDAIKYWVTKGDLVGVKAEYLTVSGKIFKSSRMEYQHRVEGEDGKQPFLSRIAIYNELIDGDETVMAFSEPELAPLPDYYFDLNLLRK